MLFSSLLTPGHVFMVQAEIADIHQCLWGGWIKEGKEGEEMGEGEG